MRKAHRNCIGIEFHENELELASLARLPVDATFSSFTSAAVGTTVCTSPFNSWYGYLCA